MSSARIPVHILCGAWPPMTGGVADYSSIVAHGLAAAGYDVHVWTSGGGTVERVGGVQVHAHFARWTPAALRAMSRELDAIGGPHRIVPQWVPHDFGFKSLNVSLPAWLLGRAWRGDRVLPLIHEAGAPYRLARPRMLAAAVVHRLMAAMLLRAAHDRVLITIPSWRTRLQRWALGRRLEWEWVPVPSNIEPPPARVGGADVRSRHGLDDAEVIGSFGIHGGLSTGMLASVLARVLTRGNRFALIVGPEGHRVRDAVAAIAPNAAARVRVTGVVPVADVSPHLEACDLLLQPYVDGVSTRRSTAMAALAHARALVTTSGRATEDIWWAERAAEMTDFDVDALARAIESLLADPTTRDVLARRGQDAYRRHFSQAHLIKRFAAALGPP
jgi:glycosyltransferase involved in cell wall biosynthesis